MSSQPGATQAGSGHDLFEKLAVHYKTVSIVLGVVGALCAAIPIVAWELYRWEAVAVVVWGVLLIGTLLVSSILSWFAGKPERQLTEANRLRMSFLVLLGGAGVATAGLGLVLPFSTPHYRDVFSGGLTVWRQNLGMLFRVTAALLGGLLLVFVGLQLARTWERSSTAMRRLLYGYNAIFSSILVLLILLLLNVLSYAKVRPFSLFAHTGDWTQARLFSLSDSSKNFLRDLPEPVKVYVLLSGNDRISSEVETLLDNCRAVNPRITWEMLSRDINQQELEELITKYQLPDPMGLLVLYGTEPKVSHEFIKRGDLFLVPSQDPREPRTDRFVFKGEGALMKALRSLAEGKTHATIYFTQGSGEMSYSEKNPFQANKSNWSVNRLRQQLESRNYVTRPLKIDRDLKQVPEDADVLVIAGPTEKWPDNGVKALRDYLQGTGRARPGKAIVCLGVVGEGASMGAVGIEPVLAEFNVRLGDERLLAADPLIVPPDPRIILTKTNRDSSNPVARAFNQEGRRPTAFIFQDARLAKPAMDNPNMPARWTVEPLLMAFDRQEVVAESNLQASPLDVVTELRRNRAERMKRLMQGLVSLGVTVSASDDNMPRDLAHAGLSKGGQPRLVVIGDARWISDPMFQTRFGSDHMDLFVSCVSWLRGQSNIGSGPEETDKERVAYQPQVPPGAGLRVLLLPAILLMLAALMMGLGVWVVRRR